jgi:hypothetical protein
MDARNMFGEQAGQEECVIADVFTDLAFIDERGSVEQRIRRDQHFAYVFELLSFTVPNPIQVFDMTEVDQETSDVGGDREVIQLSSAEKPLLYQLCEQGS